MPTARELLEQADALMRRNRTVATDDIPVLTDAVPIAEVPLPVREMYEHPEPARAAPDPIPTLTERVDSSANVAAGSMMGEGEPSDWLEFGEPQPSIMGEPPDSIAIVPPVELAHDLDDALLDSAEHEEIELTSAVDDDFDEELAKRAEGLAVAPVLVETSAAATAPAPMPAAAREALFAPEPAEEATAPASADIAAALEPAEEATALAPAEIATAPEPAEEATAPAARSPWDDQARWDAAAEEISMQVLQRIDLFTDTGLREQLGSRLKPIVDSASAELVKTINLHVGELLRAYVAEAIEREIERWREQH